MKTLKQLLFFTLISLISFSCDTDDDESSQDETTQQNQADIIGTWKFTSSTTNGEADTDFWICDFEDTLEFNETSIINKYYSDPSGNGSNCELDGTFTETYTINGNTITVDDFSIEIITLNNTTFVYKEVEEGDVYTETYTRQ